MNARSDAAMGDGAFAGELREGPDGRLYEWTEGVDGFGGPVGFWKARRGRAHPRARRRRLRRRIRAAPRRWADAPAVGAYAGELRRGPDGVLHEWVEGIDGLGQPVGFWKVVKAIGRGVGKAAGRAVGAAGKAMGSAARQYLPAAAGMVIPGIGPVAEEGVRWARAAGILGDEDD